MAHLGAELGSPINWSNGKLSVAMVNSELLCSIPSAPITYNGSLRVRRIRSDIVEFASTAQAPSVSALRKRVAPDNRQHFTTLDEFLTRQSCDTTRQLANALDTILYLAPLYCSSCFPRCVCTIINPFLWYTNCSGCMATLSVVPETPAFVICCKRKSKTFWQNLMVQFCL